MGFAGSEIGDLIGNQLAESGIRLLDVFQPVRRGNAFLK